MTDAQKAWLQVYSAVFQALLANPEYRLSWEALRDRALIEANVAMRLSKDVNP